MFSVRIFRIDQDGEGIIHNPKKFGKYAYFRGLFFLWIIPLYVKQITNWE